MGSTVHRNDLNMEELGMKRLAKSVQFRVWGLGYGHTLSASTPNPKPLNAKPHTLNRVSAFKGPGALGGASSYALKANPKTRFRFQGLGFRI